MKPRFPLTAIILAGGKSSRMGQDKALLSFSGQTFLEHLVQFLAPLFQTTLVIVGDRTKLGGLRLGPARAYEDLMKDRGPLAGIYTGLLYSTSKTSCVFTCDMPFVDESMIRRLVYAWEDGFEALCLETPSGQCQPFPGIYSSTARSLMGRFLRRGEGSMKRFFEAANVKTLFLGEERVQALTNMNTMEDYRAVLKAKK